MNFKEEFDELIRLEAELRRLARLPIKYEAAWLDVYRLLKPIRTGRAILLESKTIGSRPTLEFYLGRGFMAGHANQHRKRDILLDSAWLRRRVEEMLDMNIFDYLRSRLDFILEKCRKSIRSDLEYLLLNPPVFPKIEPITITANDVQFIRGKLYYHLEEAKIQLIISSSTSEIYLKVMHPDRRRHPDLWFFIQPGDFWDPGLRRAVEEVLRRGIDMLQRMQASDFDEKMQRLTGILKIKKLAKTLTFGGPRLTFPIEIESFRNCGFTGRIIYDGESRPISVTWYTTAWTYRIHVCLGDFCDGFFLSDYDELEKALMDIASAAWKFDFLKLFCGVVSFRTSHEKLSRLYEYNGTLDEAACPELLGTMFRSAAHQPRRWPGLLEDLGDAIEILEKALGESMERWRGRLSDLKLRWMARNFTSRLEV